MDLHEVPQTSGRALTDYLRPCADPRTESSRGAPVLSIGGELTDYPLKLDVRAGRLYCPTNRTHFEQPLRSVPCDPYGPLVERVSVRVRRAVDNLIAASNV